MNTLLLEQIKVDVSRALKEDLGSGDVTAALLPAGQKVKAEILSREPMLMCGQPWVLEVFKQVDPEIELHWQVREGQWLAEPTSLCWLEGLASSILTAERTALNFLQTLSATATQTYHYVKILEGTGTALLDTRKTIPGLRLAQKYAVQCAGGMSHRLGLYDAFLIKENHIKACGSIANAVAKAKRLHSSLLVEVEVETLEELNEALLAKPQRIMLDNFTVPMLKKAVEMNQGLCALEVSGGITQDSLREIATLGVDFISVGAITKSIQATDLSLLIRDIL